MQVRNIFYSNAYIVCVHFRRMVKKEACLSQRENNSNVLPTEKEHATTA